MSWFFASSTTFQNGNSETVNNRPINLDIVDSYSKTTHLPEGTTEILFAIAFDIANSATTLYLHYPDETARDDDFALLEIQAALPNNTKAGWHTAANFTNGNGESITNKNFNLDQVTSYYKTTSKPLGTTEILFVVALVFKNQGKPQFLYYEDETARNADFTTIEDTIAAVSNVSASLVWTSNYYVIPYTIENAWVKRNLGVGPNKLCQIKIARQGSGATLAYAGAREVGDTAEGYQIMDIWATYYKLLKTDANGEIEILAADYTGFYLTHTLEIA